MNSKCTLSAPEHRTPFQPLTSDPHPQALPLPISTCRLALFPLSSWFMFSLIPLFIQLIRLAPDVCWALDQASTLCLPDSSELSGKGGRGGREGVQDTVGRALAILLGPLAAAPIFWMFAGLPGRKGEGSRYTGVLAHRRLSLPD